MFHNISNPKWFGNWSRLEDDYLGNGGTDIADNFTFSKREKTGGLFGSIISLATAFPACDPETGHATGAWKVACESIDLDEVPLSDIADMISSFDCETITDFRLFNTGAFDYTPWQQALDEQPEEYVRRVLQDGGFRSDWDNPDYDPIGDFKETAGDEYRIPLLKVLLREQLESRYEVANHFSTMNFRYRFRRGGFPLCERGGSVHLPAKSCHFRHRGDGKSRVSLPARLLEGRGDGGFLHRSKRRYRSRGLRPRDRGEPVAHGWRDCPRGRVLHRYQ